MPPFQIAREQRRGSILCLVAKGRSRRWRRADVRFSRVNQIYGLQGVATTALDADRPIWETPPSILFSKG